MRVDVWSDVVCPFCHIGKKRLERVAREKHVTLQWHWHAFQLDPQAPEFVAEPNVERLARKYGMSLAQARVQMEDIASVFASEGIDFNFEQVQSGNTRHAHRIIQAAQDQGLGSAAEEAFFKACLSSGRAIGKPAVVRQIATEIGLSEMQIDEAMTSARIDERIEQDLRQAAELGISGVPFFVFENKLAVSGAQSSEVFAQALDQARSLTRQMTDDGAAGTDL